VRLTAEFFDRAWDRLLGASRSGDTGTDPALVVAPRRPPATFYWRSVREIVPIAHAKSVLRAAGARWRTQGSERGLVGATATIAWPGGHPTWELLAYRTPGHEGDPRRVDAASVVVAGSRFPSLFLCHDPRTRRLLVAPHTPCPILYGLRATDPITPLRAWRTVRSEPVSRWLLFRTNQASGDHLVRRSASAIPPYGGAIVDGLVSGRPEVLPGGHVRLSLSDGPASSVECLAFEPTKTLPRVARSLLPGDEVEVWGSRADDPPLRLEGLRVVRLRPRFGPIVPPRCPACHRRARSMGRLRGYRCPGCRRRWPPESVRPARIAPEFPPGRYHPTPSARRHLAPKGPEP
jgi:tRNA(Ile2)-agmatinylcytidine synthase